MLLEILNIILIYFVKFNYIFKPLILKKEKKICDALIKNIILWYGFFMTRHSLSLCLLCDFMFNFFKPIY